MAFVLFFVYSFCMENSLKFHPEINFRDLGGLPAGTGRRVKYGMFYRSAGIYHMNKEELKELAGLHIRAVLDLRTAAECRRFPDPVLPGVKMLHHSGLVSSGGEDIDFSINGMNKIGDDARTQMEKLVYYYGQMPFKNEAVHIMFDHILAGDVPILFHCASGKDRTGVAAMILLLALGADQEDALRDYMLSAVSRRKALQRVLDQNRDRLRDHPELLDLLTMKESVSEKIGRMILASIHNRYPSRSAFLEKEYGLDEKAVQRLRMIGTEEIR